MLRRGRIAANPAVMEAEKFQPLPTFAQLHDSRLGVLEREPELGEDLTQRDQRALGLSPGPAYHDHIVGEPHQLSGTALRPLPVKPVEIDVAKAR